MQQPTKRFYVYTLAEKEKVFYVGKGQRQRVHNHEWEATTDCQCHKCRKIRKIWRNGGAVQKYIVFTTDDEDEAYRYEEELITSFGLKNLCNKALGGRGSRSITQEEIEHRLWAVEQYELEKQEREAQKQLRLERHFGRIWGSLKSEKRAKKVG
jgi:hypothetical protein